MHAFANYAGIHWDGHIYVVAFCFITHWSLILFFFPLVRAFYCAYFTFTAIFIAFFQAVCVILAETRDFDHAKSIARFLLRFGYASYLFCLLFNRFLTIKRHSFDVQPTDFQLFPQSGLPCRQKFAFVLSVVLLITPWLLIRFTPN